MFLGYLLSSQIGARNERQPIQGIICLVQGLSNKEIAARLYISVHTVITHRRNITRKLQIHSLAGLTLYAIANNMIDKSLLFHYTP